LIALLLLAGVPVVMWAVQTVQLRACGLPVRWRIDAGDAPRKIRTTGRIVTQVSLLTVIVAYPLLRGEPILDYYARLLPMTETALQATHGATVSTLFLCVLYLAWVSTDRLRVSVHQSRRRWVRRLVLLVPTACFGAVVEELLFRGVVMADLLDSSLVPPSVAIAVSVLVFAGAHYVRSVKRKWTIFGHLMLGLLLCVAFLRTGTLWLAIGLHAGGIFMIMGTRPFFRNRGPVWLTGASIFPFSGAVGVIGLAALTAFVACYYGKP